MCQPLDDLRDVASSDSVDTFVLSYTSLLQVSTRSPLLALPTPCTAAMTNHPCFLDFPAAWHDIPWRMSCSEPAYETGLCESVVIVSVSVWVQSAPGITPALVERIVASRPDLTKADIKEASHLPPCLPHPCNSSFAGHLEKSMLAYHCSRGGSTASHG